MSNIIQRLKDAEEKLNGLTKRLKNALNGETFDEPIQSDKWRNIYFFKCGKSFLGAKVWPTAESAKAVADKWENKLIKPGIILVWNMPAESYSHCIQIPWKEKP